MRTPAITTDDLAARTRRRISRRLVPYLLIVFVISYLDRVNLGYANLEMTKDLKFDDQIFGTGAGIFFVGYFLLEIPGTILVETWSAKKWIARIMITWGILASAMGFIHTRPQFYWVRFLLGAAEAGFFPGVIVYLTHWFRKEDRAKTFALFLAAVPISNIIGSPISGLLLNIHWFGMEGWRWLFILEGIPAIIFGVITIFYLTDWPHQAKWLREDEKQWITRELREEKRKIGASSHGSILKTISHPAVMILAVTYFLILSSIYGFNFWLPTILKRLSGLPNLVVTLLTVLPYCVGLVAMMIVGWSSDRKLERRGHTSISMLVAGLGLFLSVMTQNHPTIALSSFCVAAVGLYSFFAPFWGLPTSFLTGTTAAAAIGLINSIGNLGGFSGPFVVGWLTKKTGSFSAGVFYLAASAIVAGLMVLLAKPEKKSPATAD